MKLKLFAIAALALAAALQVPVSFAAGDETPSRPATPANPDFEAGKAAIRDSNWKAAIDSFNKVAASDPKNADAQNWLGYAHRKSGNLDMAFKHYNEALRIDSKHKGAHEYIGEAYLMKGDVAKAKEHLTSLDRICFFGCSEYTDLKKAIAEYETKAKR
jgi:Flp pilus assembly protein TadD